MGYRNYEGDRVFDEISKQYNIMALVGNGFDMQVLQEYEQYPTTSYRDFYYFLKMKGACSGNPIFKNMEREKKLGREDWSDIEEGLARLSKEEDVSDLVEALREIQQEFSEFLNYVVQSDLLSKLDNDANDKKWGRLSLSEFLKDITNEEDFHRIPLAATGSNLDLYNYYFVNFNYTSLLDNYLFLDSDQFDPHPYRKSDRNFRFKQDPNDFCNSLKNGKPWDYTSYSYLTMEIVHPHGYQDIPRSLLFGTGFTGAPTKDAAKLAKPYWAQLDLKYKHLFDETKLFIVFGCSLGKTDQWWWKNIAESLAADKSRALIIYWWTADDKPALNKNEIVEKFYAAADINEDPILDEIIDQICVIKYTNATERTWLSTHRR